MSFKKIVILYNPNSTGDGKKNAEELADQLRDAMSKADIEVTPTEYAGHAEEIAATYAKNGDELLLVSSSGDGGYHEVVNGVQSVPHCKVVTAVLPSGNANDHFNAMASDDMIEHIIKADVTDIDTMSVEGTVDGKAWSRVAHSYIGFGLTPTVGRELTRTKLNFFNEKWHVLRHMIRFRYVDIVVEGKQRRLTNLVCATVDRMAKVVSLNDDEQTQGGGMNVYATNYEPLWRVINVVLRASVKGLDPESTTDKLSITTVKRTPIQLDGEVFQLDANSAVTITFKPNSLTTVL